MKLVTYQGADSPRLGWITGYLVVDVERAAELSGGPALPSDLMTFLQNWPANFAALQQIAVQGAAMEAAVSLSQVELLSPLPHPRSIREFYAFEGHVKAARARRGLDMVPEWYDFPVFYFSNASSVVGPDATVRRPRYTQWLDYELEIAVVIGRAGRDIAPADAAQYIAGYMIYNDFSARDIQRQEVKVGLGPAKGKDFANGLGPWLVTPDELADRLLDSPKGHRYDLTMTARVNGRELTRGNLRDIHYTLGELIAHAANEVTLYPGDVIGTGTVGTGCLLELGAEDPATDVDWLQPGDMVELEVERLGVLRNRIG